ncbi:MAG: carboxypeptidase-like regulatory domain-containing protein [Ignavibacteria bacterium]
MKKLMLSLLLLNLMIFSGCSKEGSNPAKSVSSQQGITGKITSASSGLPVSGAVITTVPASVIVKTDNAGSYELANINSGAYKINVYEPGYKEFQQSGVNLSEGQNLSLNIKLNDIIWKSDRTDNNAVVAVQNSAVSDGSVSNGDMIGVFYDSLGTTACAGYKVWNAATISVILWGDDSQTKGMKEGFQSGDTIKWKIKRASDGKVFDAVVSYQQSANGIYSYNGMFILKTLTVK